MLARYTKRPVHTFASLRLFFFALMIISVAELVEGLFEQQKQIVVNLIAYDADKNIEIINNQAKIVSEKKLVIDSPNLLYYLISSKNNNPSPLLLIVLIISFYCGLRLVWDIEIKNIFGKDHSKLFNIPLFLLLFYLLTESIVDLQFHHYLREHNLIPINFYTDRPKMWPFIFSMMAIAWIGQIFKKGYQLQQEQNLTI